ncbi:hypothetical protein MP638_001764 [Amoeboaphelidium occidentale]|nr:hypothetical protein MP638_001764 [Amoeboaphelidium occidentale]
MEKSELKGDKMDLPAECLRDIMAESGHKDSIESPLTFKLQAQSDGGTVYGGVREFTADPGTCLVSPWLYRSFNDMNDNENGLVVTVELHPLLKAAYCLLKPLADIPGNLNLKALLESHLRQNFTVISKGTTIDVNVYGKGVLSYFVELIKSTEQVEVPAAVVIDTEISVDFSSSGFTQLGMNTQESDTITDLSVDLLLQSDGFVKLCDGHIYGRKYFKINTEKLQNAPITLNCTSENDDIVVYASFRVERPSDLDFQFSSTESLKAGNSLCVNLSDYPRENNWPAHPGYLYLCIVSYGNKNSGEMFRLECSMKPDKLKDETAPVETSLCPNCRENVSLQSLQLHMLRCERLKYYCETCSSVVLKQHQNSHWHCNECKKCGNSVSEKTLHLELVHKKRYCICGFYGYQNELKYHCNNDCPKRSIICRYCHLEVEAGEKSLQAKDLLLTGPSLTQHESDCGSRTIVCATCKKSVQIKDVSIHMKMHETEKKYRPLPFIVCANKLCSLPRDYKNDMDLCNRCFGPFWLSEIDPGNKKRIQRLVHTYFKQLSSGCGRDVCLNQFCASGSYKSEGKDPNMIALDALNIAKKSGYLEPVPFREYFLCVDVRNAKIRRVAENQLQVLGNYALEFCIEALNKTKPELNDDTDDEEAVETFTYDGVSQVWLSAAANWLLRNVHTE